ncbi:DUF2746 domain-containing protein [Leifsonia virtsii]|uniref:DUF2746 domain-containing protein n=1 Tax=Leifsonia virtsii TaxID=3035915 RepID=A0ABT8J168_9MICO|nr:DUF2746 domain-containing protein [Leifsonia virtsii]MDN4598838.1 DUF2746 domain-containing protein [Leifsonia virtsii]
MSDAADITVSVISGSATVTASLIAAGVAWLASQRAKHARDDARIIKEEVKNNHQTNLREEADERHEENKSLLNQIIETQADHGERLERLEGSDETQDERIERIEHTWPRSRFMPPARHRKEDDQ